MQPSSTKLLTTINPATGETLASVPVTPTEKIFDIVTATNGAWRKWRSLGLKRRAQILNRAKRLLFQQSHSFAELISMEMGKPYIESLAMEVEATIDLFGYYTGKGCKLLSDRPLSLNNIFFKRRTCYIHHQPLGTLAIISPWNWPLLIPMGSIIPALLAGNAVIFKHSEHTPLIAQRIEALLWQAGVPRDVYQTVYGQGEAGEALVSSDVAKIFFTGSTDVGQKVMQQAAKSLKKAVLELGGNDPALICADADIENSSSGILWGAFNNCGQNCNSVERVYVNKTIADRFIERLLYKTKLLRLGEGTNHNTDLGPLAFRQQLNKISNIVEQAKEQGDQLLCGGEPLASMKGCFYQPTIFLRKASVMHPPDQEIFGPVLFITPVDDDEHALKLANTSNFGLSASVWTENIKRGQHLAYDLACGNVMINDCIVSFGMAEISWTGVKQSGIGWVHGEKGLDEMVNIQYITIDKQSRIQKFWWFPYTEKMVQAMRAGLEFLFAASWRKKTKALPSVLTHFTAYFVKNSKRTDKL